MNVYRVTMRFYDGDAEHGYYSSPTFVSRDLAEDFLAALRAVNPDDPRDWWTSGGIMDITAAEDAEIEEIPVREHTQDAIPGPAKEYRMITWT